MAAEIFTALSNLRIILETETDDDSPLNLTTYRAIRYAIEALFILFFSTGDTGSATTNPPDDATGVLTDTGAAYAVDVHNGRTLLMTSGDAKGELYTIDDGTATTLICTGDNLYSDGVRSGDDYHVLYDLLVNTDGHDHDGVNSPFATLPAGSIMLPAYDHEGGTEYDEAAGWATIVTHRVFIEAGANVLRCAFRVKISVADSDGGEAKITIGGQDSDAVAFNNAAYAWALDSTGADVSGLSGWYDLEVKLRQVTIRTAYIQGYATYRA